LFGDGILAEAAAVQLRGRFRATKAGAWRIGMSGVGACTLELDGQTVLDEHLRAESADLAASFLSPPHRAVTRQLVEGQEVLLAMTWRRNAGGPARLAVTAEPPAGSDDEQIEQAVALARRSDAAIVVVGTGEEDEREGFDRHSIALPGRQDDLVRAVAAVNPRTIVVVNAGAPVAMPWRDRVAAVLLTWFPGQEFGNALADVLLGTAEPGGRLPTTWAAEERDVPVLSTRPTEGVLAYTEGIHIGYRAWLRAGAEPAYPFGHGLGYTTWVYVTLDAPATAQAGTELRLRVHLRNSGARRGKEVVQAYLDRADSAVERPARWLAGFAVAPAAAGDTVPAELRIAPRAFEHWCERHHAWHAEAGRFRLRVGRSVADLRLAVSVELTAPPTPHPSAWPCANDG
jgi:beta-glucosidase